MPYEPSHPLRLTGGMNAVDGPVLLFVLVGSLLGILSAGSLLNIHGVMLVAALAAAVDLRDGAWFVHDGFLERRRFLRTPQRVPCADVVRIEKTDKGYRIELDGRDDLLVERPNGTAWRAFMGQVAGNPFA